MNDRDIDAEFDAIVAHWDDPAQDTDESGVATERIEPTPPTEQPQPDPGNAAADDESSSGGALDPRAEAAESSEASEASDRAETATEPPTPGDSPATGSPPSSPGRPLTVHDITAAYAALSRPEPAPPSADRDSTTTPTGSQFTPNVWRAPTTPSRDARDAADGAEGASGFDEFEEDDHFDPPEVHLPPTEDIGYWGALLGLVGGPLVLLWVLLTNPFNRGWWLAGAILLFLGGFALLIVRQPHNRDPFDDDDGARV